MSALRTTGAVASLGIAAMLMLHFAVVLRPVVFPTLRQLGQEETTYFVLRVAGISLRGWQVIAVERIVLLMSLGLILLAVYVLASGKSNA